MLGEHQKAESEKKFLAALDDDFQLWGATPKK
jgi:hypothetical protein